MKVRVQRRRGEPDPGEHTPSGPGCSISEVTTVQRRTGATPALPGPPSPETAVPRRIATISLHTSPLDQPGTGDAGGMNVYVVEVARRMAERGLEIDIFTRATCHDQPPVVELSPGVTVRHVPAGPFEELDKADLPDQLCPFTFGVLRAEAARAPGHYDLIHSHYWLSGRVGAVAAPRWGVPLVHSMHTLGKVKNAALATGETPEPDVRLRGEAQVVASADRLVANTADEAGQLVDLYGAPQGRVATVTPGVDLDVFTPGPREGARRRLGLAPDSVVLLFVGRVQPLKAPDLLLEAAARLVERDPSLRDRLVVAVVGGLSGSGLAHPSRLRSLAERLGLSGVLRMEPPRPQPELAHWYRAATATVVPSYSESFGLVAVESQACGTPVVASAVGGLTTAVADGISGTLVEGHDPEDFARALGRLVDEPGRRARQSAAGVQHAAAFGWDGTVDGLLAVYRSAVYRSAVYRGAVRRGTASVAELPLAVNR
ncbi:MAG: D-inositol-3-phosphate glycosyltransferase [Streptosporangiales bacterium]|nr:D-inositol-3-phosphate glycosyltransferase [Streptosporangiales bacterium]